MDLEMRPIAPEEIGAWKKADARASSSHIDEATLALHGSRHELDRSLAVFDGGEVIACAHASSWRMTVPGGSLPVAGVSTVSVQPTHRRRGILSRMMNRQLRDAHNRGEPLATL